MTHQPLLFGGYVAADPAARRTDPETSHDAAAKHTTRAACNKAILFDALKRCTEPVTAIELRARLNDRDQDRIDRYECSKRLSDLAHEGLIQRGTARACRVKGSRMLTWSTT